MRKRLLSIVGIFAVLFALAAATAGGASAATPTGHEYCEFNTFCIATVQLQEGVDYAMVPYDADPSPDRVVIRYRFQLIRSATDICTFETDTASYFGATSSGAYKYGDAYYMNCKGFAHGNNWSWLWGR